MGKTIDQFVEDTAFHCLEGFEQSGEVIASFVSVPTADVPLDPRELEAIILVTGPGGEFGLASNMEPGMAIEVLRKALETLQKGQN